MSELIGKRIGDYEILGELGAGGMGRVYKVRNVISDRIEAMKVLLPDLAGQQELAARFLREIKLLATLNHPNIAALRTALTLENRLVMIMEYVQGTTLSSRLARGPVPVPEALNYIDQVLAALSYAHGQHVTHRDIKPANMMVTSEGVVKLMDFGIAHAGNDGGLSLTATGTTLGSINYMSPEQVQGKAADARSDLYSLGISLYEMVTGQRPFESDSEFAIMTAHVKEIPRPPIDLKPGLPVALNQIILTAIGKDPKDRFQSADAFRNAISNVGRLSMAQAAAQGARAAEFHDAPTATTMTPQPATASYTQTTTAGPTIGTRVPSAPPPAASPARHRGLYMALGAMIVLVVMVALGAYLPKRSKAAAPQAAPAAAEPTPAPTTAPTPPPAPPDPGPSQADLAKQAELERQAELQRQAELEKKRILAQVERHLDELFGRAAAVNASLDRLQQQQAAAGYGLRGDIVAKQGAMQTNLTRAQHAVERRDAEDARRYADMAATNVEELEHFLGR